jgi:hypothetical protein
MPVMMRRTTAAAALAVLAAVAGPAGAAEAQRLDQALAQAGPEMVRFLQQGSYKVVGVLPLRARIGNGPLRADLGPLHRNLARRLEVALVLALPDDSITLVSGAGDAVAGSKNPRVNHTTPSGRRQFFQIDDKYFQSAWGDQHVRPEVFLTGEATLNSDYRNMEVRVQAFDRQHPEQLREVCHFTAAADARTLTEAGVSFARPRGFEDGDAPGPKYAPPSLVPKEVRPENPDQAFLVVAEKSPVRLEVLYDGKPVQARAGLLPTPGPDETVTFRLTNEGDQTCGALLKINGRNTIFNEEADDLHCHKWVLKPGQSIEVQGFQKDDDTHEAFKVKPEAESRRLAELYGEYAGTIELVVFREARGSADEAVVKNEERRSGQDLAIARGSVTPAAGIRPREFRSLKSALADEMKRGEEEARKAKSRGLIVPGEKGKKEIEYVSFSPYPRPVVSLSLRYYEPK